MLKTEGVACSAQAVKPVQIKRTDEEDSDCSGTAPNSIDANTGR
jgi:hypothetical protein